MSDPRAMGKTEERTARVWQPADYLSSQTVGQAFEVSPWAMGRLVSFVVPSLGPPPQEEVAEELDEIAALGYEAARVEPEPAVAAQAIEPEVHSESELERVRLQALEEGRQQGLREAADDMSAQAAAWREQAASRLDALERGVRELMETPDQLHEPLKRLALHLAEQLVIGELSISPQAVDRLVRRCVEELDAQRGVPVRVEVHPDDLGPLQEMLNGLTSEGGEASPNKSLPWVLQANASVLPGSVRASANDATVFDLIEHRLEALAAQLLRVPAAARHQSAFKPERLAARKAEVSQVLDAQPRMSEPARGGRFAPVIEAEASSVQDTDPDQVGLENAPARPDPGEPLS